MTYLQKYLMRYHSACSTVIATLQKAQYLPLTQESIDERLKAIDLIIRGLQDARRYLLYFKNRGENAGLPPPHPKPGDVL